MIRRARQPLALLAAGALVAAACGGDVSPPEEDVAPDEDVDDPEDADDVDDDAAVDDPDQVNLTFWTWVPDIEMQIDLFEEAHPHISVERVDPEDLYQQLRTALEAGTGAPDVTQIEYQFLPSFVITESLIDLSEYGAADLEAAFEPWVWDQVTGDDGEVWAIPQDTGPVGMLYREDIFEEHGIDVPTTWDEFAEAGRQLRDAAPDTYITNFAPNDAGWITSLFWQAGWQPFERDGEEISIDLDNDVSRQVTEYWQELIDDDVVSADPAWVDEWYRGFIEGRYATWITAAWGPVFLEGAAEETAGLWRATQMPQWEPGGQVSSNWGGSTNAVTVQSEHPEEAALLAQWINTEFEPALMFATEQFFFPPQVEVLEASEFYEHEFEFYGGQRVNEVFVESSEQVETGFEWSPFQTFVYDQMADLYGAQAEPGGDLVGGLAAWEQAVVDYAESQGFTVR
jgi:multiple sugar transport system substrate-binding protein